MQENKLIAIIGGGAAGLGGGHHSGTAGRAGDDLRAGRAGRTQAFGHRQRPRNLTTVRQRSAIITDSRRNLCSQRLSAIPWKRRWISLTAWAL